MPSRIKTESDRFEALEKKHLELLGNAKQMAIILGLLVDQENGELVVSYAHKKSGTAPIQINIQHIPENKTLIVTTL